MRRLIYGLLAAIAVASAALAAQNIRQNNDGTASWNSSRGWNNPLGAAYLQVLIPNLSVASTFVLVSPISDAKITDVRVARTGGPSSSGKATITISTACTSGCLLAGSSAVRLRSTHGVSYATIQVGTDSNISSYAITQPGTLPSGRHEYHDAIEAGGRIFINTDGASTGAMSAHVIITIQPK